MGFDPGEGALEGEPAPVLDRVAAYAGWRGHYAVSKNGTLVYRTGGEMGMGGDQQLLVTDLDGNEDVRPLEPRPLGVLRWSPDGSSVAFQTRDDSAFHIYTYDDGSLAAYTSDETGMDEVYVRSFPTPRQPVRVSEGGGRDPRWSPGGDTLYYWRSAPEDTLFTVRVRREPTFAVLSSEALLSRDYDWVGWDLHPAGDRFAVPRDVSDGVAEPGGEGERGRALVVTNWFAELRAALGDR